MAERDQDGLADADRPARIFRYQLGSSDALAYKLLRRELSGREKFKLLVWIGLASLAVAALPESWPVVLWWIVALGILALAAVASIVWSNIVIRRDAARMKLPTGELVLEEWQDRLVERNGAGERKLAYVEIAQVIETSDHVFLRDGDVPLIVPRSAFANEAEMADFARRIDEASEAAQP